MSSGSNEGEIRPSEGESTRDGEGGEGFSPFNDVDTPLTDTSVNRLGTVKEGRDFP